jgi:hypothetical protein
MFSPVKVIQRVGKAVSDYGTLAKTIVRHDDQSYTCNNYKVDLKEGTCECHSYEFSGEDSPCKHIFVCFLHSYFSKKA